MAYSEGVEGYPTCLTSSCISSFLRAGSAPLRHSGGYLNATRLAGSNKLWVLQMLMMNKNRLEG